MLEVRNLSYSYGNKSILNNINYNFEAGRMYAITGESGSGKTTLLGLLAGLENLKEGEILFNEKKLAPNWLTNYRRQIGIVFQSYNLIWYMTPLENVITALDIVGIAGNHKDIAKEYLNKVGLDSDTINRKCNQLSGGQQQRVAIARALASKSEIIFADEPTGNLDKKTSKEIITLLKQVANEMNRCVICVTHDIKLARFASQILDLEDGELRIN